MEILIGMRAGARKMMDERLAWTEDFPKLKRMIQDILFCGTAYPFEADNYLTDLGVTFGFLKEDNGMVAINNRIFETKLYDLFLSEMILDDRAGQTVSAELQFQQEQDDRDTGDNA